MEKSLIIDWKNRKSSENLISILDYLDSNESEIRSRFFKKIDAISEILIAEKQIFKYFSINGYNLWFMSTFYEKSFYKTPQITDVIKYISFEKIINEFSPEKIIVVNSNSKVNKVIKYFCLKKGISICIENESTNSSRKFISKIYFYFKALIFLLTYLFQNIFSFKHKVPFLKKNNTVFIISYLTHFNKDKITKQIFGSNFWGDLPEKLRKNKYLINWLHLSINQKSPDKEFRKLGFKRKNNSERHNFEASYLTFKSWRTIIKNYLAIIGLVKKIKLIQLFSNKNLIDSFFLSDFLNSFLGPTLIQNLIYIESFDNLFKDTPRQNIGFYLQENQGWELSLVHAWKKYNHGKLISVQHSTVSFWDLRYNNLYNNKNFVTHSPDFFAVNGFSAKKHFTNFNYPKDKILHLEALRYLNLNLKTSNKGKGVLILGDIIRQSTKEMLNTILPLSATISEKISFKSHPAQLIEISKIKYPNVNITDLPLEILLDSFDTVVCCSSSSVAVESYLKNLKTIVFISPGELNTSPLKGYPNVFFVSNKEDLNMAINYTTDTLSENDFFYLDKSLSNWISLIKNKLSFH